MKRVVLSALILIVVSLVTLARPQRRSIVPQQNKRVQLTADNMLLVDKALHCKGNAEVRIAPIHADENLIIIQADEVIHHSDTNEIETRGDARITIEKAQ